MATHKAFQAWFYLHRTFCTHQKALKEFVMNSPKHRLKPKQHCNIAVITELKKKPARKISILYWHHANTL